MSAPELTSFTCRGCGEARGRVVLDLGLQPLANRLLEAVPEPGSEPRYPLRLFCCDSCQLLQLIELIPPEELFSHYLYFSSFSESVLKNVDAAAEAYTQRFGLGGGSLVVEIASNDGYFLKNFVRLGIPCFGIEPAQNIAEAARAAGVETRAEFFSEALAAQMREAGERPDLIIANNVFAHVPQTQGFVKGLALILADDGTAVLEFPYAAELILNNEFDTIYHEHVFYFFLSPLIGLFARAGLEVYDVERIPIHGGSLRLFVGHRGRHEVAAPVTALLEEERELGVQSSAFYEGFAERVAALIVELREEVLRLRAEGASVAAYGASAKGSTLLNAVGLDHRHISFVADRSHYKQGLLTPGTHIPIVAPERLVEAAPDYALLLSWNFLDEILEQQRAYREGGGRFLVPIPKVRVV